ncbi:MAG: hypothetical protein IPQ07_44205 [Myxococcales bacterium]|nr:hypothetical protein [Myxococcales bacterium]
MPVIVRREIIGSAGYSRGEDKLLGPAGLARRSRRPRPGGLVAGVLRDGDWNIAMKWLGDNKIANNPDDTTWDPDALNWLVMPDYLDAGAEVHRGLLVRDRPTAGRTARQDRQDGNVCAVTGVIPGPGRRRRR